MIIKTNFYIHYGYLQSWIDTDCNPPDTEWSWGSCVIMDWV